MKVQVNIKNVPAELIEKARRIAEEQDRNFSQVMRELIRVWVAEQEAKAKAK